MAKKIYVLDTSVYLTDTSSINSYGTGDIVIPFKVLEEIDKHKKRQDSVGANAREIIRKLDEFRIKGSLKKGVRIARGKGIIRVRPAKTELLPPDLDSKIPDNEIISVALVEKNENPTRKVILVSRDINMRIKCDAIGILTEDYIVGKVVKSGGSLYSGVTKHLVDDQTIDRFYEGEEIFINKGEARLCPNQFIMLVSNANEKKTALARFYEYLKPLKKVVKHNDVWGIKPRNKEQSFALELLLDEEVPVVTLVGKAGSGKTLCAVASGLQQTLEGQSGESSYTRLIISRPIQPMGRDIGYLPGTIDEKMAPWIAPIQDNLEYLMGNKKNLDIYMNNGIIEVEALTYIRGRSIANAFIIVDEAQQLTKHEIKTILTRVGEGTKIVFTGDIEQIDNVYVDETSNGLTYIVEKFKDNGLAGHITLLRGERSKVATTAAKIL